MHYKKYLDFVNKTVDLIEDYSFIDKMEYLCSSKFFKECAAMGFIEIFSDDLMDLKDSDIIAICDIQELGNTLYSYLLLCEKLIDEFEFEQYLNSNVVVYSAFDRIRELVEMKEIFYENNITRFKLRSKYISNSSRMMTYLVEETTVFKTGRVKIEFFHSKNDVHFEKQGSKEYKLSKKQVEQIFSVYFDYFNQATKFKGETSLGNWDILFYHQNQTLAKFRGGLGVDMIYDNFDISDMLRSLLDDEDLFVFDAGYRNDVIEKIKLDVAFYDQENDQFYNSKDILRINRMDNTLEYMIYCEDGMTVMERLEGRAVSALLNNLLQDVEQFENHHDEEYQNPQAAKYILCIDMLKKGRMIYTGYYDSQELSENWPNFVGEIYQFISTYREGQIFDPNNFGRKKPSENETIVCRVLINDIKTPLMYIADDENIRIYDSVVVPVGINEELKIGQVVFIDYISSEELEGLNIQKIDHVASEEDYSIYADEPSDQKVH